MAVSPKPSRNNDEPRPNLNAALGALNSITRLYVEVARFLQSVGIVYKVPENLEVDHSGEILVEVENDDEADILRKATQILARNASRPLHRVSRLQGRAFSNLLDKLPIAQVERAMKKYFN